MAPAHDSLYSRMAALPVLRLTDRESMDITDLQVEGYERVARAHDPQSGLRAIISVHSTALGPARWKTDLARQSDERQAAGAHGLRRIRRAVRVRPIADRVPRDGRQLLVRWKPQGKPSGILPARPAARVHLGHELARSEVPRCTQEARKVHRSA